MLEPNDPADRNEWRRIHEHKPALHSFDSVGKAHILGYAKKETEGEKDKHKDKGERWFVLVGNFLLYFRTDDPQEKLAGAVYLGGSLAEVDGQKMRISLMVPSKPAKHLSRQNNHIILTFPDSDVAQHWAGLINRLARPTVVTSPSKAPSNGNLAEDQHDSTHSLTPSRNDAPVEEEDDAGDNEAPHEELPPLEEEPEVMREGFDDNGEPSFMVPLQAKSIQHALEQAGARGDNYAPLSEFMESEPIVPAVSLPPGLSACGAFQLIFTESTDFMKKYHDRREDFNMVMPAWPSEPEKNGPPFWLGWRQLNWECVVMAPTKKQVAVYEDESYVYCQVQGTHKRILQVYFSSMTPKVPMGETFRVESLIEFLEDRKGDAPCHTTVRVYGKVTFLKNTMMAGTIRKTALKEMQKSFAIFNEMATQYSRDWASRHKAALDHREALRQKRVEIQRQKQLRQRKPARRTKKKAGAVSLCFGPPPETDPRFAVPPTPPPFPPLSTLSKQPEAKAAKATERLVEGVLWQAIQVDPANSFVVLAALRAIREFCADQLGQPLNNAALDTVAELLEQYLEDAKIVEAALRLLHLITGTESHMTLLKGHATLPALLVKAVAHHRGSLAPVLVAVFGSLSVPDQDTAGATEVNGPTDTAADATTGASSGASTPNRKNSVEAVPAGGAGNPVLSTRDSAFRQHFMPDHQESVIDDFSCAWNDKGFLRQGRLYITQYRLCFWSPIGHAKLYVRFKDIAKLEKRKTALVFDNAIEVVAKESYNFTSFMNRDKAFGVIAQLHAARHTATVPTES
eukprot:TRINITY_DN2110_c0_g1_i1.p2 TRINITY_DN2110_c0_g1~~TRINITY_DN2110_c0_g1_i1.p2  ORF type:complete len:797 (-),score=120.60 TRINITY_DN2110_c0_g1_i1:74-2464(-)